MKLNTLKNRLVALTMVLVLAPTLVLANLLPAFAEAPVPVTPVPTTHWAHNFGNLPPTTGTWGSHTGTWTHNSDHANSAVNAVTYIPHHHVDHASSVANTVTYTPHHNWDHTSSLSNALNTINSSAGAGHHHWFHNNTISTNVGANTAVATAHSYMHTPINMDLTSTMASVSAGWLLRSGSVVDINVGGTQVAVSNNTLLTPAEKVAVYQMLFNHTQSIVVDSQGSANGGTVVITPRMSQMLGSLDIPSGVTVIDLSRTGILNLTGNIVDNGNLYITSTNPTLSTFNVGANNIDVQAGGILSDVLPTSSLTNPINLDLTALNSITNAGTITSSGNLGLIAGSGNVTNSGLVASNNGNINIAASNPATNINVNGTGGTFQALNGNINVGDVSNNQTANTTLNSGNYLSQNLNINAGSGTVAANVEQVTGNVNITAGSANVVASTGTLDIGNENISGDPSFYNTTGNVIISGDLSFSGQDLAIVAEGNITNSVTGDVISTANSGGTGGNIVMIAGANFSSTGSDQKPNNVGTTGTGDGSGGDKTHTLTISGGTAAGGYIDLTGGNGTGNGATPIGSLTSAATASSGGGIYGSGGNITIIAYGGTGSNAGRINVPKSVPINANGVLGVGGNVILIAGSAASSSTNAINVGAISSTGYSSGGAITLALATPKFISGTTSFTLTDKSDGTITGSDSLPYATTGTLTLQNTSMSVGTVSTNLGTVTGDNHTITFISGTGNIGTSSSPIALSAPIILINSTGNVYLKDSSTYPGTVGISSTSHSAASVSLTDTSNSSTIIETGLSTTGTVALTNSGSNSSIELNGTINSGSGGVTLTTTGTGTISGNGTITTAGTLSLVNTSAGAGNMTITSTNAPIISLNSTSSVVINDTADVSVSSNTNTLGSLSLTDSATSGTSITVDTAGLTSSGTLSLSGSTIVVNGAITAGGTVNITSTQTTAGTGIAINAQVTQLGGSPVNLTVDGYDGSGSNYTINGSGNIIAGTLNITFNNTTTNLASASLNGNAFNNVGTLNVTAYPSTDSVDRANVTLNNGTNALALGSMTNLNNLRVWSDDITTSASNTFAGTASLNSITTGGSVNISLSQTYYNLDVNSGAITIGANISTSGQLNLTSTQTSAGTGIAVNAQVTQLGGSPVNLTVDGYDGSGSNYTINGSGNIIAGTLNITFNNTTTNLASASLNGNAFNNVGTLNVTAYPSTDSVDRANVTLNNGTNALALGTMTNLNNLRVWSDDITTSASNTFAGTASLNSITTGGGSVNISLSQTYYNLDVNSGAITIGGNISTSGQLNLTSTQTSAGTGIAVNAQVTQLGGSPVNLTVDGYDGSGSNYTINGSGNIIAGTLNITFNNTTTNLASASLNGNAFNNVGTLNVTAYPSTDSVDRANVTLNNGTNALALGTMTNLNNLRVWSDDITTSASNTFAGTASLNSITTGGGSVNISLSQTYYNLDVNSGAITIGANISTSGQLNLTSTQTTAGTGIAINAQVTQLGGSPVNLTVDGYDGSGSNYVISEGASGTISAGTLTVNFNNTAAGTSTANLTGTNAVGTFNASGNVSPAINNATLNNGTTSLALGSFSNISNLTVSSANNITTSVSSTFSQDLNLTGTTINVSQLMTAGTVNLTANTVTISAGGVTSTSGGISIISNLTAAAYGSGNVIAIDAPVSAAGQTVSLTADSANSISGTPAISESGTGSITAGTLNITLNSGYGASASLTSTNAVGILSGDANNSNGSLTLNNGTTALTLDSLTFFNNISVTAAGNISTDANASVYSYNPVALSLNSSGTINLSTLATHSGTNFSTVSLSGTAVTVGVPITASGSVGITSTQTTAATGIEIDAPISASGQTVTLSAAGTDGGTGSGPYVINQGTNGSIAAGTLNITFNNVIANTSTSNLLGSNNITTLNATGQTSPAINNIDLSNGSNAVSIGSLVNINNLTLTSGSSSLGSFTVSGDFNFTTTATSFAINNGTVITAGSITINLPNGSTFNDNGTLAATSGGISIDPSAGLTLSGTATFTPSSGNNVTFSDASSIALSNGLNYTVTGSNTGIVFTTPVLNIVGPPLLSASATVTAPNINIAPSSGNLSLGFASTLKGTLNLNGPVELGNASTGQLTVGVLVSTPSTLSITANNIAINRTISGSDISLTAEADGSISEGALGGLSTSQLTVNLPAGGTATLNGTLLNNVQSLAATGSGSVTLGNVLNNIELLTFGSNQSVDVTTGGDITTSTTGTSLSSLTLSGNTVTLSENITSSGDVDITSTRLIAGAPDISIGGTLNAGSHTVNLTADGHDSATADAIEETGTGSITAGTLNLTLNGLVLTTANLSNTNSIGTLNAQGSSVAFSIVTINNGTTDLALGSFSHIYNLQVNQGLTAAGNISMNADFSGSTFGTISLTGNTVSVSESFASNGAVNITSTQTSAGTGIEIDAPITASSQTVTLSAAGIDGGTGTGPYVINEGTNGSITAGTLTVAFNNTAAGTSTANLASVNTVNTFNAGGNISPAINNVTLNNGSTATNIGYLININNFNLITTGPLTFNTSFTTAGDLDFSTTASSITINSGVVLTANSITFDLENGGSFNNNGSLVATGAAGSGGINIDPAAGLVLSGTSSYSPGAGNYLNFSDTTSITLSNGLSYTVTNGAGVNLTTPLLIGQSGGTTTIAVSQPTTVFAISSNSSTLEINGSSGTTVMNFNGAAVNINATTSVQVDSGVTVSADSNSQMTVNSPTVTVSGTVQGGGTAVFATTLNVDGAITATNNAGGANCCIGGLGNVLIQGLTPSNALTINLTGTIGGGATEDVNFNPGQYYGNSTGNGAPGQTTGTLYNSGYGFGNITINSNTNLPTTATGTISASNAVYFNNVSTSNTNTKLINVYVNSMPTGIFPVGGTINVYVASGNVSVPFLISNSGTVNITANNGNISLQNYGVKTAGAIDFTSSGSFTLSSGDFVNTTNAAVTINASAVTIVGTINAGTATVSLLPNGNQNVTVGDNGTASGFDVSSSALGNITASTLVIGTSTDTGTFTTGGSIDVSGTGAGAYKLTFNTGGNFSNAGNIITLGSKSLTVTSGGTANTGSVTSTVATTVDITAGNKLTVDGAITIGTVTPGSSGSITLQTSAGSNALIAIQNAVSTGSSSKGTITVTADGSSKITDTTGVLTAGTVTLASISGNIGTSTSPILLDAAKLSANTTGIVYLSDSSAVTIAGSSKGAIFDLSETGSGDITVSHGITATGLLTLSTGSGGTIKITATSSGAGINLTGGQEVINTTLSSTGTVNIVSTQTATGTGISLSSSGTISANGQTVNLTVNGSDSTGSAIQESSGSGIVANLLSITFKDISGTATADLKGSGNQITTLAAAGKATAADNITLNNGSNALALGTITNINDLNVTAAGAVTTTAISYTFGTVSLTGVTIDISSRINATGTTAGEGISLTSTQPTAGTGITIGAVLNASGTGQVINLTAYGSDGSSSAYVINETTGGQIRATDLVVDLKNDTASLTSTAYLNQSTHVNIVSNLSGTGGANGIHDIVLNDKATSLNVNSLTNINNLTVLDSPVYLGNGSTTTISGDTTIYNAGDIFVSGLVSFTNGSNLDIIAEGSITANNAAAQINTKGANLLMVAGASMTGEVVNINSPSALGGNIDLSTSTAGSGTSYVINTVSTANGGNVTLIALGNGTTGGYVNIGSTGNSIHTSSTSATAGGNVLIYAGGTNASGNSITLGNVVTRGGSITLSATQPSGNLTINNADSSYTGTLTPGSTATGNNIVTGNLNASGANGTTASPNGMDSGNVTITAGTTTGTITTGQITASGGAGSDMASGTAGNGGNGGTIFLQAGNGITSGALTANGGAGGNITTDSGNGGNGGAGGNIAAILYGAGSPVDVPAPNFSGPGGLVTFVGFSTYPPIIINGNVTTIGGAGGDGGKALGGSGNGGNGGNGGNIYFSAGAISLGSFGFNTSGGNGGDPTGAGGNGGNGGNITLIGNGAPIFGFILANGGIGGAGNPPGLNGANGIISIIIPPNFPGPIPTGLNTQQLIAFLDALAALLNQNHLNSQIGTRIATDYDPWMLPQYWPKTQPLEGEVEKLANNINGTLFASLEFSKNALDTLANNGIQFGPGSGKDFFDLQRGNVFFMANSDIRVKTREGTVHIPKGAVAWIMETGADSAIYDCHDNIHTSRIKVEVNGKKIAMAPGTQVVLTRNPDDDFASLNPGYSIGYRNVMSTDAGSGIKAFVCNFSITHLMANIPIVHDLLKSNDPQSIKVADAMIKNAVILNDLTGPEGYTTNMFVAARLQPPAETQPATGEGEQTASAPIKVPAQAGAPASPTPIATPATRQEAGAPPKPSM